MKVMLLLLMVTFVQTIASTAIPLFRLDDRGCAMHVVRVMLLLLP
jgi:hypothetical protein